MEVKNALKLLIFPFVFLLFLIAPIDTDLGWHFRYGNYMLENFKLFYPNQLTYFLDGYTWENSYTLYQIITTLFYNWGGFLLLTIAYALLGAFSFWVFSKFSPKTQLVNALLFFSITCFGWNVFGLGWRAQVFSFLFLTLTYLAIYKAETQPKLIKFLPLVFPFWANLHGGFSLGLFVLFLAMVNSVLQKDRKLASTFFTALSLSALASLLNPYGLGIWEEVLRHFRNPLGGIIIEWTKPPFWKQVTVVLLTLPTLFLVWKRSKNPYFWILNILFFAITSYSARRNLPFWSLSLTLPLLIIYKDKLPSLEKHGLFRPVSLTFIAISLLFGITTSAPKALDISLRWNSFCGKGLRVYPCRAIEFLQTQNIPGKNVFSTYEWGGILEWQLPQYKYFVDGRTSAWDNPENRSPYLIYSDIVHARGNFLEKLDAEETDILLLPYGVDLDLYLSQNPDNWKKIYTDPVAVIYTRLD